MTGEIGLRSAIVDAAESAICEEMGSSLYYCLLLSAVGGSLAQLAFGRPYHLIVGSLRLVTQLGDEATGVEMALGEGGSFHAIFGCKHEDERWELADLSSRHYRTYTEANDVRWDVPDPPEFLWGLYPEVFPKYAIFTPDQEASREAITALEKCEDVSRLIRNAIDKLLLIAEP